jgi:hypothetical protein
LGSEGILLIDYLPKGQTINAEYYWSLMVQMKDFWRKNAARGYVTKGVLFFHDNAPYYNVFLSCAITTYIKKKNH